MTTYHLVSHILFVFCENQYQTKRNKGQLPQVLALGPSGVGHAGMQVAAHTPASAQRRFAKIDEEQLFEL